MDWLEVRDFWPMSSQTERSGQSFVDAIVNRVIDDDDGFLRRFSRMHFCEARSLCPFKLSRQSMANAIKDAINVDGLRLDDYRSDNVR